MRPLLPGAAARVVDEAAIANAVVNPPQSTRARLRGRFVKAAQAAGVDYTVDWVHLKLNDRAHHTILCKDPFANEDPRVDELLDTLRPFTG